MMDRSPMRCLFSLNVWGERYLDYVADITLPMLLSPGNLGALPDIDGCEFLIHTRAEDIPYLLAKPQFKALQGLMPVRAVPFDIPPGGTYQLLGSLQAQAMQRAQEQGFHAIFPLYADGLFADGTIASALRRLKEGNLAVLAPGPQAIAKPVLETLQAPGRFAAGNGGLAVPPRVLVDQIFRNLHPFHAADFWDSERFTGIPSMIFWRVPDQGVLVHAFHLHPVALAVQAGSAFSSPFFGTLDEHYLPRLFPDSDRLHIMADSDEGFVCSIDRSMERGAEAAGALYPASAAHVARWAERCAFMLHRALFRTPIRLHARDLDPDSWMRTESEARKVVSRILYRLTMPAEILRLEDPQAFANRKAHRAITRQVKNAILILGPASLLACHALARLAMPIIRWDLEKTLRPKGLSPVLKTGTQRRPAGLARRLAASWQRFAGRALSLGWLRPKRGTGEDEAETRYRRLWVKIRDSYYDPELSRLPLFRIYGELLSRLLPPWR